MRIRLLIAGAGLFALGTGNAWAQAAGGPSVPRGPDAQGSDTNYGEQTRNFNHVISNINKPANSSKTSSAVRKVAASDIAVGASVRDVNGQPIGKVASIDADGVVVDTGQAKVKVPLIGFGKDNNGLLIGITAQKFAGLVAQAHAQSAAAAVPAKPQPRPATVADIAKGAPLRDVDGQPVGKITFVSTDGATIDTGSTKVKLPIEDFGVDSAGLVLPITVQKLNELIAQSRAAATKK